MLSSSGSSRGRRGAPAPAAAPVAPTQNASWAAFLSDDCGDVETDLTAAKSAEGKPYVRPRTSLQLHGKGGRLAQAGTLDWDTVGRSRKTADSYTELDLFSPTLLSPSCLGKVRISFVAASPSSCHSIAVSSAGAAYGWGRNDHSQLGLDHLNTVVAPTSLELPFKVASAAVGKAHTILISPAGDGYGAGRCAEGQLGTNQSVERVPKFKKMVFASAPQKLAQASCGDFFTVCLDDEGRLYSTGLSQFGALGNGETGEFFVTASKLAFANCQKLTRRETFCRRDFNFKEADAPEFLPDSSTIRLQRIACGKSHTVAIECARVGGGPVRVFTWGCGDYGSLGHRVQKDEYYPRLVETLAGPMFNSNAFTDVSAGTSCSMVNSENGQAYMWGKFRSVGEATMQPALIDFLANNGHEVAGLAAGNSTVILATAEGQTVSYGQGPYGELGYGVDGAKSSSAPQFIESINGVKVMDVAAGYGHTLFVLSDEGKDEGKMVGKLAVYGGDASGTPKKKKKAAAEGGAAKKAKKA
ncbi:hypothetical protein TeGR_g7888 [Tetraparma gracilis]|uniref:Regulator of chromosome condensation 1/beta-lactamase-inhibitor protein II n=1 Tax=Tetraparma gracilis TaxID=2962635 RepID=A0ABQ6MJL9_9STRA|nr:hypothetical protein TeGR_g7888 [Tetraparma gracilis]